jgi:hypothetical protein
MADSNGMNHECINLRDLGHLPHERALTIDENENVVICGRDGKWVKTGEKLSPRPADVLQDSLRVPDLIQQNSLQNMREQLDLDPHSLINTSVYRRFTSDGVGYKTGADDGSSDDPVAHGIVKEFWLENGLHRWRILYDGSHVEDFDSEEMMEFGLDRKSGSVATFSHTDLPASDSTDQINSNQWVTIKAKRNIKKAPPADRKALLQEIVDSQQPAACLCGCSSSVIITLPNESFRELCLRIPGVLNNRSQYYDYLLKHHNYGHDRAPGPGFSFNNPFARTSEASRQLLPDIPFPIPDESFVANAHKLNSDALNPDFEVARLRFEAFEYAQAEEMCATSRFPDEVYRDILNDD